MSFWILTICPFGGKPPSEPFNIVFLKHQTSGRELFWNRIKSNEKGKKASNGKKNVYLRTGPSRTIRRKTQKSTRPLGGTPAQIHFKYLQSQDAA